jgi:hypothetical protein
MHKLLMSNMFFLKISRFISSSFFFKSRYFSLLLLNLKYYILIFYCLIGLWSDTLLIFQIFIHSKTSDQGNNFDW